MKPFFIKIGRVLWARRGIVLVSLISTLAGAAILVSINPSLYLATAKVRMDLLNTDDQSGALTSEIFAKAYIQSQAHLLRDDQVATRVVEDLGWLESPQLQEAYNNRPLSDDRDIARWAAQRIIGGTSAQLKDESNILEISFRAESPEMARTVVESLRRAYIDVNLETRRESARRDAIWLAEQADLLRVQIAKAAMEGSRIERESGVVLQGAYMDLETEHLRSLAAGIVPGFSAPRGTGPTTATTALLELDARIAQMSATMGPNNPALQAMRQQRPLLVAQAEEESKRVDRSIQAAFQTLAANADQLTTQRQKVSAQRDSLEALFHLQDQIKLLKDRYEQTTAREVSLRQRAEVTETELTPIGTAEVDGKPYFPNIPLIGAGATVLGTALGVVLALLAELLSRRVRSVNDLRAIADAPIVIAVPMMKLRRDPIEAAVPGDKRSPRSRHFGRKPGPERAAADGAVARGRA